MAFRWLVAFLNNCISTNIGGPFESFRFFNQEITLVAGLASPTFNRTTGGKKLRVKTTNPARPVRPALL
jgi:hypothetical protein